jgi:hypothetical protein
MVKNRIRALAVIAAATTLTAAGVAGARLKDSPPVGPLPAGPTSTIDTQKGQLVAFALPHRSAGRVWRVARKFDAKVVQQVTEGDVGPSVVLVFKATGKGTTTVVFGLTRGETAKAYESRRFTVRVR